MTFIKTRSALIWAGAFFCLVVLPRTTRATQIVGDVAITKDATSARVHWLTDVATGTRLEISPEANVHLPADRTPTTDHLVTIDGLRADTNYTVKFGTARLWLGSRDLAVTQTGSIPAATPPPVAAALRSVPVNSAPPTRETWGHLASLPDHFARHGSDFGAKNPDDYARLAWEFLQRAKAEGLPAKLDPTGTLRVFDPQTGTFAAYNRNGTTKTFFKPGNAGYFERQPGRPVNLKTWR